MDMVRLAAEMLPAPLEKEILAFPHTLPISDIRLRSGQKLTVLSGGMEYELTPFVSAGDLEKLLERSTDASPYAVRDSLAAGYVAARFGIRIGFCGEVVSSSGLMKNLSSAAIRLPSEQRDWGKPWVGHFVSTLILSPPGCGKTTLLRDMVRLLSDRGERVGLCDDRGELAAVWEGKSSFDIGRHTDVISGGKRSETALMLLRNMDPTLIAMDELTGEAECEALLTVSRCGVSLLATAHAASAEDLEKRGIYRELLRSGAFQRLLLIDRRHHVRELYL